MKKFVFLLPVIALLSGCSGEFWGGAGTGAVGAGAAYELSGEKQLRDLEQAREEGRISQEEYEIRRDQIESDFLLK